MPTAAPLTAATSGLSNAWSASSRAGKPESMSSPVARRAISSRSWPAENARPAPVSTATFTPSSARAPSSAAAVARYSGESKALRAAGRSRVSRRTAPWSWTRTRGSDTSSGCHVAARSGRAGRPCPAAPERGHVGPGGTPVRAVAAGPVAGRVEEHAPAAVVGAHAQPLPAEVEERHRQAHHGPRRVLLGDGALGRRDVEVPVGVVVPGHAGAGRVPVEQVVEPGDDLRRVAVAGGVEHGSQPGAELGQGVQVDGAGPVPHPPTGV